MDSNTLSTNFQQLICAAIGANKIQKQEDIQTLWSGYGVISRYMLNSDPDNTVVIKHIRFPDAAKHPRGWDTQLSHQRKVKSYEVEFTWYDKYSSRCSTESKVPQCIMSHKKGAEAILVLEDLDRIGFNQRKSTVTVDQMKACLDWLANFHASFMGVEPDGLWPIGTYWHLDTRPDELKALDDNELKNAAKAIDKLLNTAKYKCFVHGDAKLANFCFHQDGLHVAGVDFQYIGGGCGMKDVAYFIGSCLYEEDCGRYEQALLNHYFGCLETALSKNKPEIDYQELEREWRSLFPVAWTDFHRFIKGWSPGHWKINSYSEQMSRQIIQQLQ